MSLSSRFGRYCRNLWNQQLSLLRSGFCRHSLDTCLVDPEHQKPLLLLTALCPLRHGSPLMARKPAAGLWQLMAPVQGCAGLAECRTCMCLGIPDQAGSPECPLRTLFCLARCSEGWRGMTASIGFEWSGALHALPVLCQQAQLMRQLLTSTGYRHAPCIVSDRIPG